jgi:hypothetical protein
MPGVPTMEAMPTAPPKPPVIKEAVPMSATKESSKPTLGGETPGNKDSAAQVAKIQEKSDTPRDALKGIADGGIKNNKDAVTPETQSEASEPKVNKPEAEPKNQENNGKTVTTDSEDANKSNNNPDNNNIAADKPQDDIRSVDVSQEPSLADKSNQLVDGYLTDSDPYIQSMNTAYKEQIKQGNTNDKINIDIAGKKIEEKSVEEYFQSQLEIQDNLLKNLPENSERHQSVKAKIEATKKTLTDLREARIILENQTKTATSSSENETTVNKTPEADVQAPVEAEAMTGGEKSAGQEKKGNANQDEKEDKKPELTKEQQETLKWVGEHPEVLNLLGEMRKMKLGNNEVKAIQALQGLLKNNNENGPENSPEKKSKLEMLLMLLLTLLTVGGEMTKTDTENTAK